MGERDHLPKACGLSGDMPLGSFDADAIASMIFECEQWLVTRESFRRSITSPSAQTVWRVVFHAEGELVRNTYARLLAEAMKRRITHDDELDDFFAT